MKKSQAKSRAQLTTLLVQLTEGIRFLHSGDLYELCSNVSQTYAGDYVCEGCRACGLQDAVNEADSVIESDPVPDIEEMLRDALRDAIRHGLHKPTYVDGPGLGTQFGEDCAPECWCWEPRKLLS